MNGKAQFYLNIGVTLMFGMFGLVSAVYTEIRKPTAEWNAWAVTITIIASLGLFSLMFDFLSRAKKNIHDDRE